MVIIGQGGLRAAHIEKCFHVRDVMEARSDERRANNERRAADMRKVKISLAWNYALLITVFFALGVFVGSQLFKGGF